VVVTANYRLGVLGTLVAGDGIRGNLAIKDQRLALEWVVKNIAAFGGNATDITIFGESAGGSSVATHLVAPKSTGLFSKAIIQSGPFALPMKTIPQALKLGKMFVDHIRCPWGQGVFSCLSNKTIEEIIASQSAIRFSVEFLHPIQSVMPWTPVIDGDEMTDQPWSLIQSGKFNKVPLMLGTVGEEAWMFTGKVYLTQSLYILATAYLFGVDMVQVLRQYPVGGFWDLSNYALLLGQLGTDYLFACLTRHTARSASALGSPTYLYHYNHSSSFDPWGRDFAFCNGHACHGSELAFVFHSAQPYHKFNVAEEDLSQRMVRYWTNFAKSGNPNAPIPVEPRWPQYDQKNDLRVELVTPPTVQSGLLTAHCDFWDGMGYNYGI